MADLPDWTGKMYVTNTKLDVEVINSQLDVNVTNSNLNVNVTNSTVPVTVQNASLDVNVTNSTLNVSVSGTANVNVENAQLNVKTLREQASETGNITFANTRIDIGDSTDFYSGHTIYTNNETTDVYLEQLLAAVTLYDTTAGAIDTNRFSVVVDIFDGSNIRVRWIFNTHQAPINFDPAVPVHPGEEIRVALQGETQQGYYCDVSAIIRTL